MTIREEHGITPTHDIERLPVDFYISGRVLQIKPLNVVKNSEWMASLAKSPAAVAVAMLIECTKEAHKLKQDGNAEKAAEKIGQTGAVVQEHLPAMLHLAVDYTGWDAETRDHIIEHATEEEVMRLFMTVYFLGNRLRTTAIHFAALASASPTDSAASNNPDGATKTKRPSRTSTTSCSKSART